MQLRLSFRCVHLFFIILLVNTIYSAILTNICPITTSCNCTLINNTELNIICNSTTFLTELPTLSPSSLQTDVLQIYVRSSKNDTKGPLIKLPTNICSYPNVAVLDLSSNNISGLLNTSELACLGSKLTNVDFSSNSINGIDFNFFQANGQIQSVDISQNYLTSMPLINGAYFVSFPSTFTTMNFSFNQISTVDFWPLFVKTRKTITIDMSNNIVENYTNTVPISVSQLSGTPDPRYFNLSKNRISSLPDTLLEQYGACESTSSISMAYFIVGISNLLLTDNNLTCDCESYQIIQYIIDGINDFPDINNGSALITQALCYLPISQRGVQFIFANFDDYNDCSNYTSPNITDIFCSLNINDSRVTLTTPTYWLTSTTSTTRQEESTGAQNGNSSSSSSWFIILGVVLGLVIILVVVIIIYYLYHKKIFFKKKILTTSIHSSQGHGTQRNNNGLYAHSHSAKQRLSWNGGSSPNQGTQTNFQNFRPKLSSTRSTGGSDSEQNHHNYTRYSSYRERRLSSSMAIDASTNTTNIVKGIPISSVLSKTQSVPSTGNNTKSDPYASQLTIASIPMTPSKRAKILPPVKNGIFADSVNDGSLLNTSAGTTTLNKAQRARSAVWPRKPNSNLISPLSTRPQSLLTEKTILDSDESFFDNTQPAPTFENLADKPSKFMRTVPLLNISVMPAWVDNTNEQL